MGESGLGKSYKVCHMTSAHGVEDIRIFQKECISLAEHGYEVFLVERGETYEKSGVQIVGVGEISKNRRERMRDGAKRVYLAAKQLDCDLYHIHDPELLSYALKLKKAGKKVVFDSHELTKVQMKYKSYMSKMVAHIVSFLYGSYESYVLKRLDGVIFPCKVNGKFPLPGKRIAFLNNYPKLSELYDQYDPNYTKDDNSICTIGSLTYNRGIKHLILAASKAKCKVYLGGMLSPDSFKQEIEQMPESSTVEFLGYIDREKVIDVYKRSTVGAAAVLNIGQYYSAENLSTKVYECMAMGMPVIINRQPYTEKVLRDYEFGICVEPEDIDEYAAAIKELTSNPEKAQKMGENGRKAIKEIFNWEKERENLFELYHEILGGI